MIHLFGTIAFLNYFQFTGCQIFRRLNLQFSRISRSFLLIGIISNLVLIFEVLQTDIANFEGSIFFESHPSLILLLVSAVLFLFVFFYKPDSLFVRKIVSIVTLLIFIVGAIFLHQANAKKVYELSPLLITHILVSLISQVYLVFIFLFSLVLVFVDRNLKSRKLSSTETEFPPLMPTEKMWMRVLGQGIFVFVLTVLTGFLQIGGLSYSTKFVFAFLGLLGLLGAYLLYKMTSIRTSMISLGLAIYIPSIFIIQILARNLNY